MQKTFIYLMTMLLLLAGCSSEDSYLDTTIPSELSGKIRWYGSQLPKETQTRGLANNTKLWNQGTNITVKFISLPADRSLIDTVKQIAAEWEQYANIKFDFVRGDMDADVRIAFDWMGNNWMTWSYTGTDAKTIKDQRVPTAVFAGLDNLSSKERKGDILRLFGQVLGLEYEQRHQLWAENGYWTDESQLQEYWEGLFYHYYQLKWDEIRDYVFTPMTQNSKSNLYASKDIDKQSIMAWPYYDLGQSNLLIANYELSAKDKEFVAQIYPKDKQSLPTIQEAWVDAGYFSWTNSSKTALKITKLGAQQETLPDVRDGEQLTSAYSMFMIEGSQQTALRDAPLFNTSNITDFSYMFSGCQLITTVPDYDTAKGTNFRGMFYGCYYLTYIPLLDTSNGINFYEMFSQCYSLKSIPLLNTAKGTNFGNMFYNCYDLKSIPQLNTANGTNFSAMFNGCSTLTDVPQLNTAKGTDFSYMFSLCPVLKNIPLLDTAKGTNFLGMFHSCKAVTSIPQLNTTNGTNFKVMFKACSSLKTIPLLNTKNGTDFESMFDGCTVLTGIPELNTTNGTIFRRMFADCPVLKSIPLLSTGNSHSFWETFSGCTSLTEVPLLDLSSGTNLEGMFKNCSSLKSIPQFNTSVCIGFTSMFSGCKSLTSIPQLDMAKGIEFIQTFYECESLTSVPYLNTTQGTNFNSMFFGCKSLTAKPEFDQSNLHSAMNIFKNTPYEGASL